MYFKTILVVCGLAAATINAQSPPYRTSPSAEDLEGFEWVNKVRQNPRLMISEL